MVAIFSKTEAILGPFAPTDFDEDVDGRNEDLWAKGMPTEWLAFHVGNWLSGVNMRSGEYATLREPSYDVIQRFDSLADWYERLLLMNTPGVTPCKSQFKFFPGLRRRSRRRDELLGLCGDRGRLLVERDRARLVLLWP